MSCQMVISTLIHVPPDLGRASLNDASFKLCKIPKYEEPGSITAAGKHHLSSKAECSCDKREPEGDFENRTKQGAKSFSVVF